MGSKMLGIWQDTRIVATAPAYLDDVYFKPRTDGADIDVTMINATARPATVRPRVSAAPIARGHQLFDRADDFVTLQPGESRTVTVQVRGVRPQLWSPDHPNLYRLTTSLQSDDGTLADDSTIRVGFRTFVVDGNQLLLNGKPFWMRGAGQMASNMVGLQRLDQMRRWTTMLRGCNVRITRMHLGPAADVWFDVCDELGMGVDMEGVRPWVFVSGAMPTDDQAQSWRDEMGHVVRRLRNHPSLLIWTTGNELEAPNLTSWTILSSVNKVIRDNDATRPLVTDSSYVRNPTTYQDVLQPAGIDDGDIDDEHVYPGWYSPSAFVIDPDRPGGGGPSKPDRPFISAEMSTGYPDFHTGMPWPSYLGYKTPNSWVGHHATDTDPTIFLDTHALLTKELAEQLRRTRDVGNGTAGFLLFSSATWFKNYNDASISPFPVCDAVRTAYQPIVASLDSPVRHFYTGETFTAQAVVMHDDADRGTIRGLRLAVDIQDGSGRPVGGGDTVAVPDLAFATNVRVPVKVVVPRRIKGERLDATLVLTLTEGRKVLARNSYEVVVATPAYAAAGDAGGAHSVWLYDPSGATAASLQAIGLTYTAVSGLDGLAPGNPDLLVVGKNGVDATVLAADLLGFADGGGRVVILEGGTGTTTLLPNDIASAVSSQGEVATAVVDDVGPFGGLEPMDLRWWRHSDGSKPYVLHEALELTPWDVTNVRRLAEFYPPHGYSDPVVYHPCLMKKTRPEATGYVLISELATSTAAPVDPLAGRYLANVLRQSADVPLDPPPPTWDGFTEGFENGLSAWTIDKGIPTVSTDFAHTGTHSFAQSATGTLNLGSAAVVYRRARPTQGRVSMWLYDDASVTSTILMARVDNGFESGNFRGLGVMNGTHYAYRVDTTQAQSSVERSTGWHELVWDYTSGTGVTMSIDGIQVAASAEITEFDTIAIGDWWGTSAHAGSEFIDDITVSVS